MVYSFFKTIKQVLSERLDEFEDLYIIKKKKQVASNTPSLANLDLSEDTANRSNYAISDCYLDNEEITDLRHGIFIKKIESQISIIESVSATINNVLFNICGILQAELFDNELDFAKDLYKNGHLRAA